MPAGPAPMMATRWPDEDFDIESPEVNARNAAVPLTLFPD